MFENIEWRLIARDEASAVTEKVAEAEKKLAQKTKEAGEAAQKSTGSWKDTAKGFLAGGLAVNALNQAFSLIKGQFTAVMSEAEEYYRVQGQLNAVLTSTKGSAGIAIEELNNMASTLSKVTAVDGETINSLQAMLLTFTNITKGTFEATTKAALDVATAMNGGVLPSAEQLKGTAIQLGKALNDPKEGLTALTRVGVTFTQSQKDLIEKMQKAGDVMGAQKMILAELSKEFGGSAEAAANTFTGRVQKLKNAVGDVYSLIGQAFIPTLSIMVGGFTDATGKIQINETTLQTWQLRIYQGAVIIKGIVGVIVNFIKSVFDLGQVIFYSGKTVVSAFYDIEKAILGVVGKFTTLGTTFKIVVGAIKSALSGDFAQAIKQVSEEALGAVGKATKKIMNEIGDSAAIKDSFKNTTEAFSELKSASGDFASTVTKIFDPMNKAIEDAKNHTQFDQMIQSMVSAQNKAKTAAGDMSSSTNEFGNDAKKTAEKVGEAMKKLSDDYSDAKDKVIESLAKLDQEHSDKIKSITDKITTLKNELKSLSDEFSKSSGDSNKSEAEKVIEQEQKVADLKKRISEEQKNLAKNTDGNSDTSRLTDLQSELSKEEQALRLYSEKRKGLDAELAEARRRSNLTEFERFVEDLNAKRTEAQKEYDEKVGRLKQEIVEQEASRAAEQLVYEAKRAQYLETQESFKKFHDNYLSNLNSMNKATKSTVDQMNLKLQQLNTIVAQIETAKNKAGLSGAIISDVQETEKKGLQTANNNNTININLGGVTVTSKADADNLVQSIIRQLQLQGLASA